MRRILIDSLFATMLGAAAIAQSPNLPQKSDRRAALRPAAAGAERHRSGHRVAAGDQWIDAG